MCGSLLHEERERLSEIGGNLSGGLRIKEWACWIGRS